MKLQQPFYIEKRNDAKRHLDLGGKQDFCYCDTPCEEPFTLGFEHSATIPAATYWNIYEAGILPHPYEKENSYQ